MADVKWIKITTEIFDDEKILLIESLPAADSIITIWFKLLVLAGKQNNSGVFMINDRMPYTDEMLATIFRRDINTVRLALDSFENFGMIERVEGVITIPNWGKYQTLDRIESRNEYMRNYMAEYRDKQKMIISRDCKVNSKVNSKANSKVNVNKAEVEEEKEIEIEKEIEEEIDKDKKVRKRTAPISSKTFFPNDEALEAKFHEFIEHRKRLKKPLDEYKAEGIINELEKLSQGDNDVAIQILQQSIDKRWQGIFALKESKPTTENSWLETWRNA